MKTRSVRAKGLNGWFQAGAIQSESTIANLQKSKFEGQLIFELVQLRIPFFMSS